MTCTIQTSFKNVDIEKGIIERIYSYSIFSILVLYWVFSPQLYYNRCITLEFTPIEMITVSVCYSILITSTLLVIYYNTKNDVTTWITKKVCL